MNRTRVEPIYSYYKLIDLFWVLVVIFLYLLVTLQFPSCTYNVPVVFSAFVYRTIYHFYTVSSNFIFPLHHPCESNVPTMVFLACFVRRIYGYSALYTFIFYASLCLNQTNTLINIDVCTREWSVGQLFILRGIWLRCICGYRGKTDVTSCRQLKPLSKQRVARIGSIALVDWIKASCTDLRLALSAAGEKRQEHSWFPKERHRSRNRKKKPNTFRRNISVPFPIFHILLFYMIM